MGRDIELYKEALNRALHEHGISRTDNTDNIYKLVCDNRPDLITAQLIGSDEIDLLRHGSCNGNEIQAIGYFRFKLPPPGVCKPNFIIFGFRNPPKDCIEFIIIPTIEMNRRVRARNRTKNEDEEIELQFWLMEDKYVFETSGISMEGEWWFINGRMGEEQTDYDYSIFLNKWDGLMMT